MAQVKNPIMTLAEFSSVTRRRCISVHVQDHVIVWFTQLLDGSVEIDTYIHNLDDKVILNFYDRPKYTVEQAYEIYVQLQPLV